VLPGASPCGRTNIRLKGWMGRADQTAKVRGMFVHPSQIAEVVKRHPEILRARLVIDREQGIDTMTLHCETVAANALAIGDTLQAVCKLKGKIALTAPQTLPNDGKVIDDRRSFS
jgi:phenylacetate-CoA ligase